MPVSHTYPTKFSDWEQLWRFGVSWALRPVPGLVLPGEEAQKVMIVVLERFLDEFPAWPGELKAASFIHTQAVRLALETARRARLACEDIALWHDASHRSSCPIVDLAALQSDPDSPAWAVLLAQLRPKGLGFLLGEGVGEADADDLCAEAIAALAHDRRAGTPIIQDLLVQEQIGPVFFQVLKRRWINSIRHRQAARRSAARTVGLSGEDAAADAVEQAAFENWRMDSADPFSGLTLARIVEDCACYLSDLQQHILNVLYISETATYMEVASSKWFAVGAAVPPGCSDATRRRALDREHDAALDQLAACLGISRR